MRCSTYVNFPGTCAEAFQYYNAGYGSAVAWVIAAIVLILAIPYIRRMARN